MCNAILRWQVEAYNGKGWRRLPDLLTPRSAAAAAQMSSRSRPRLTWSLLSNALVQRGYENSFKWLTMRLEQKLHRLYVVGGSDGERTLNTLESFDGTRWRAELPLLAARQQHVALFFRGRLWVFGGVVIKDQTVRRIR
jgi:hypothetical protein